MLADLDETKIVLHKTIESVLERGEKIDDLVVRSFGSFYLDSTNANNQAKSEGLRFGSFLPCLCNYGD